MLDIAPAPRPRADFFEIRDAALRLAGLGFHPFPMITKRDGRRVPCRGWRTDARPVREIFAERSHATAIGLRTDGFFVIDLDRGHANGADGVASFAEAVAGRPLPRGPRARTKRGGLHLYFRTREGVEIRNAAGNPSKGVLWPGVDTRGWGGLIIVAPTAGYAWSTSPFECAIPLAPDWLIDLMPKRRPQHVEHMPVIVPYTPDPEDQWAAGAFKQVESDLAAQQKPGRDARLFSSSAYLAEFIAAGRLRRSDVESALYQAAQQCGLVAENGEAAVRRTMQNGIARGLQKPRAKPQPKNNPEPRKARYGP